MRERVSLIPAPKQPGIPKKGTPTVQKRQVPPPKPPAHPVRSPTANRRGG